ncbi:MAG: alpha/beta hydrolase, partial [Pseudomonadota bacterium]|nr:alpha/beta hydrolase [Pseudomonadota bacterium]
MTTVPPNFTRRDALGFGSGLVLVSALPPVAVAAAQEPAPPPALPVPEHWRSAPRIALWPGPPPGASTFRPATPPQGWPDSHPRAVATPDLTVFRPERPNGRSVLVMPGGA